MLRELDSTLNDPKQAKDVIAGEGALTRDLLQKLLLSEDCDARQSCIQCSSLRNSPFSLASSYGLGNSSF